MNELTNHEASEIKNPEATGFKEIKSENTMSKNEADSFWDKEFNGNQEDEAKKYYDDNGKEYRTGNDLEPNYEYEINSYKYRTDSEGRIVSAEGKLQIKDHENRNNMTDSRDVVGKGEMLETDDRGHLIADRFNGSGGIENVVPMDAELNKKDLNKLENTLAKAVNDGADVRYKIEPKYEGDSNRPSEFKVSYSINGEKEVVVFKNGSENK